MPPPLPPTFPSSLCYKWLLPSFLCLLWVKIDILIVNVISAARHDYKVQSINAIACTPVFLSTYTFSASRQIKLIKSWCPFGTPILLKCFPVFFIVKASGSQYSFMMPFTKFLLNLYFSHLYIHPQTKEQSALPLKHLQPTDNLWQDIHRSFKYFSFRAPFSFCPVSSGPREDPTRWRALVTNFHGNARWEAAEQ